jgi:hypothetical protein
VDLFNLPVIWALTPPRCDQPLRIAPTFSGEVNNEIDFLLPA